MAAIIDFFKGIGDAITSCIDFLIGFIADIVYMIELTAKFVAEIPNYFSWLPGGVLAIIVAIFAIVVIYKVLGREG